MKSGANRFDQNEIRRLAKLGHGPKEISDMKQIDIDVVKNFWPEDVEIEEVEDDED